MILFLFFGGLPLFLPDPLVALLFPLVVDLMESWGVPFSAALVELPVMMGSCSDDGGSPL